MDGLILGLALIALSVWLHIHRHAPVGRTVVSIPIKESVLCAECECITPSKHSTCQVCGSTSLLNLARVLQGRQARLIALPRSWSIGPKTSAQVSLSRQDSYYFRFDESIHDLRGGGQ
jgi:hypothetical protein